MGGLYPLYRRKSCLLISDPTKWISPVPLLDGAWKGDLALLFVSLCVFPRNFNFIHYVNLKNNMFVGFYIFSFVFHVFSCVSSFFRYFRAFLSIFVRVCCLFFYVFFCFLNILCACCVCVCVCSCCYLICFCFLCLLFSSCWSYLFCFQILFNARTYKKTKTHETIYKKHENARKYIKIHEIHKNTRKQMKIRKTQRKS